MDVNISPSLSVEGMGSAVNDELSDPFAVDWDSAAAEAELQAIEAAYFSKRPAPGLDASAERSPRRRRLLLDWNSGSRQPSGDGGSLDAAPRQRSADGPPPLPCPADRIWALAPRPCRVNYKLRHSTMTFGGRIVYCRTTSEVDQAALDLLNKIKCLKQNSDRIPIGFDIEWRPVFRQGQPPSKAAVMQICVDMTHCYVMHIIHSGIPPSLKYLLEDSSSVKVGIGIGNDATKMSRDYGVSVEPLEDLSVVANLKLGGRYKNWSLAALTEMLTCKELAKPNKIRMGNWEACPLSKEQLEYAATDGFVSWYLYQVLMSFPDWKPDNENPEKANDVKPGNENLEKANEIKLGDEKANDVAG